MRINSPESIRRARAAYARYGSWDAVMKAGTLSRDVKAGQTPLQIVSRPVMTPAKNEISLWVEPFSDPGNDGFLYLSRNSCAYNQETFDSRGHLLTEEIVKKGGLFTSAVVKYRLLMRATKRASALAQEAQKLWDEYHERIASGELELLLYLPTYGEGAGKHGNSKGHVKVQPTAQAKAELEKKR